MPNKLFSRLNIRSLELNLHLGWRNKERTDEQVVLLDMEIRFPSPPIACTTDDLQDTVCYAKTGR